MTIKRYISTYGTVFLLMVLTSFLYMLHTVNTSLDSKLAPHNSPSRKKIFRGKPLRHQLPANLTNLDPIRQLIQHKWLIPEKQDARCSWWNVSGNNTSVQMHTVYDELPFDNPNGGAWKQGWQVTYPSNKWNAIYPLKVFVVPHSHTDPGWLMTFTEYYRNFVKNILDNMLVKLEQYPEGRFIYAEISFFHLWWQDLGSADRNRARRLLDEGRFEIVTGGWVMNDEANTHYFAMVDQLIEGHQWLNSTLRVSPRYGWAIDPFGHTPTMAYLLQQAGIEGAVLQRVHYAVKKYLARTKQLEFMWRQTWDTDGRTDLLAHLMPYYFYDIPHTCGPDPSVCCEFDFARRPIGAISCPWPTSRVRAITDSNVKEKSNSLTDQWKKKAVMYRSNTVLVPLGDDFRYTSAKEWDDQFTNYFKLFQYINEHTEFGVKAQFGTLSDYFRTLRAEISEKPELSAETGLPTLSGDFFTYADKDDHYWSGYFTSRPLQKNLNRKFESHLRGAEILFTLARTIARRQQSANFPLSDLMGKLVEARRNLGLFQHHDGITGTAKDPVVIDYTTRLVDSIEALKVVIRECATYLTGEDKQFYNAAVPMYDLDERKNGIEFKFKRTVINVGNEHDAPRPVMFYNSLGYKRKSVVSILVNSPYVLIRDHNGQLVQSQTEPYWRTRTDMSSDTFEVSFEVTVSGIGIQIYTVRRVSASDTGSSSIASVSTTDIYLANKRGLFNRSWLQSKEFAFENCHIQTVFDGRTGLLRSVFSKSSRQRHKTKIEFVTYGTKFHNGDRSGAYLFLPDGPAKLLLNLGKPKLYVTAGPVRSSVRVQYDVVTHIVTLTNATDIESQSVAIENIVDIRTQNNFELALRISTGVNNTDRHFFTDLNGFQIHKRKTYDKLPLQANVYPMTSMAFIQDDQYRHTILSANSLGFSSLTQGTMEVMLDRRLNQDDSRGLLQGVTDNKVTPSRFRLLIEKRASKEDDTKLIALTSVTAHQTSLDLVHSIFTFPTSSEVKDRFPAQSNFVPLLRDIPCDIHVLNLRTMHSEDDSGIYKAKESSALILHKVGVDCTFPYQFCDNIHEQIKLSRIFNESAIRIDSARESSLTMMYGKQHMDLEEDIAISPMDIKTIVVYTK